MRAARDLMKEENNTRKFTPLILGVDIGGSHITTGIVDIEKKGLIPESIKRKYIDSSGYPENILNGWTEIINESFECYKGEIKRIGIAMPGPFDYENGISLIKDQDKFKSLYQLNIKQELAQRLSINPSDINFINDAAAFMQGEVFCGAAKGYSRALGLTLGTGLGSAVVVNGQSKDAELWNSKFLNGIAEDYFSTRWFVTKYKSLTDITLDGVKELADVVKTDLYAMQVFNEFGRGLGHFLADIIKETEAEVVILGGNIAQAFNLFAPHLIENLKALHLHTEIKITELNEHAALIGAASSWDIKVNKPKRYK
ncbi:MAG: ROK family protein [Pedobacter sp.]|nr:MAG: ROK family protein [Pedobacter sp.]